MSDLTIKIYGKVLSVDEVSSKNLAFLAGYLLGDL